MNQTPFLSKWLHAEDDSWRPQVSYFKAPISNVLPSENISLQEVHRRITGAPYAAITRQLRALEDPRERRRFKAASFPYVTFAGCFAKRQDSALLTPSLLMVLDFDHLSDLPRVRQQLLELQAFDTELLFISPSGDGLKWIIRFDREDISYEQYFISVANYLAHRHDLHPDASGKDRARACFLPHDPDAYLNGRHFEVGSREAEG